jgi:hypothetical protein
MRLSCFETMSPNISQRFRDTPKLKRLPPDGRGCSPAISLFELGRFLFERSRVVPPERRSEERAMQKGKKEQGGGFRQDGTKKDEKLPENSKKNLDKKLDHALEETFPTSDPVSVKITK